MLSIIVALATWGVVVAAITLFIVVTVGGSVAITSIIVGVSVPALALAPTQHFSQQSQQALIILVSLIIENLFSFVAEKAAGMMTKSAN